MHDTLSICHVRSWTGSCSPCLGPSYQEHFETVPCQPLHTRLSFRRGAFRSCDAVNWSRMRWLRVMELNWWPSMRCRCDREAYMLPTGGVLWARLASLLIGSNSQFENIIATSDPPAVQLH